MALGLIRASLERRATSCPPTPWPGSWQYCCGKKENRRRSHPI